MQVRRPPQRLQARGSLYGGTSSSRLYDMGSLLCRRGLVKFQSYLGMQLHRSLLGTSAAHPENRECFLSTQILKRDYEYFGS